MPTLIVVDNKDEWPFEIPGVDVVEARSYLNGAGWNRLRGAKLFNDLAMGVGGRLVGGPAKVSVVASALLGMISGSAATNVTPMIRKTFSNAITLAC